MAAPEQAHRCLQCKQVIGRNVSEKLKRKCLCSDWCAYTYSNKLQAQKDLREEVEKEVDREVDDIIRNLSSF